MVYRFTHLSRQEVETMLGISLQETRVYQEAKEEGRQEALVHLVERLLTRRLQQDLPEAMRLQLVSLSVAQLEALGEAALDLTSLAALEQWLATRLTSAEQ